MTTTAMDVARDSDLSGQTVLITGGTSGLGIETAKALAEAGADLVLTGRNMDAGQAVIHTLSECGEGRHRLVALDLADPADIARFASELCDEIGRIDVLIANAGIAQTPQDRLANGLELRFATNYLGHFLLVHELWPLLAARGSRLVLLGSAGHKGRATTIGDLSWERREIDQRVAYGESKAAISLFAVEATRRWHASGIFANCVLPGSVVTGLQRHHTPERMQEMLKIGESGAGGSVFTTPQQGAATSVWAAIAPELESVGGLVLEDCGLSRIAGRETHPFKGYELHSTDSQRARELYDATVALIAARGIPFPNAAP
ncbi:SDR family NAD(P)-dependent oxidoreductase [Croceicoccus sp. BE223]|uniref:SDR family NAD(P)-dependent oxidoreductase n=1 Tax=Croceicoccus sp. BE223 TaxID=2817716 RepID=UPI002863D443|nr:SDR family NAD(P)-dependent oxidoreductase [Croceicoccus sp. BE223]MDR7103660.1 NAD(P)-dependent dehydrogenase (short-subunit alcohol dehydrogenase family) [Croceicoccus sp. BE223]